jgi:mono/diheme cytochrome c family protein
MIRAPQLWPAVLSLSTLVAGCGRDQQREASVPADTLPAPQTSAATPPSADTVAPAVSDTSRAAPRESTVPSTRGQAVREQAARGEAAREQASGDPKPAVTPKPDTPPVRPNVDPRPTAPAPPLPREAVQPAPPKPAQDTGRAAPAAESMRDAYHQAPKDTVSQAVYNGWKQYNLNCARCHGEHVLGTTIAPHLIVSLKPGGPIDSKELFVKTVCEGRPEKGMPAWCPLGLDNEKIEQLYAYVKSRSDGKVGPGRPAVRP